MLKRICFVAVCGLLMFLAAGCNRSSQSVPAGYFKTQFQDESQFIVETIASDLAEQMFYARYHQLPDENHFRVIATEKPGSSLDTPTYDLDIFFDRKHPEIKSELNVNGPIWSADIYQNVAHDIANSIDLHPASPPGDEDTIMLAALTDSTAESIESQNQRLSDALEENFTDPALHEQAAALLGAFALREHSGDFYDIRYPLSRITAHLAMAEFLAGTNVLGLNGKLANAMMLTLVGNEAPALEQLNAINTSNTAVAAFSRALQARNTGDYRTLNAANNLTGIESIEWFCAMAGSIGPANVWPKLSDAQKQTIDFVRVAYQQDYSVEMGHQLLAVAIPLEMKEISSVYMQTHHEQLTKGNIIKALNAMPEGCLSTDNGHVHVHVIGWGQWAAFLQRQLCHAMEQDFNMLQYKWGVPDDAKAFAARCDKYYDGLRLYPFVRRFNAIDVAGYHKAVDDGFKVTVATPQLTPAECWNYLCWPTDFAPLYSPNPNPHVNEWHRHNPPPGTAYDLTARLYHPSMTGRGFPVLEKLRQLAPYDIRLSRYLFKHEYNSQPTYDQAMNLFSNVLDYNITAIRNVAQTLTNDPAKYETLMLQGARLSPTLYYSLGDYFYDRDLPKAESYYDQACDNDPDSVRASNYAYWRTRYYLKIGQIDKARKIAEQGGEVYSEVGLEAQAVFFELTHDYDQAFDWYSKCKERYDDAAPLVAFCMRYKVMTGDTKYDNEVKSILDKIFPKGLEFISVDTLHGPPSDGVLVEEENDKVRAAGMHQGDVIVGIYGYRMHNFNQYTYGREWSFDPEMDLIVWQGSAYHEISVKLPNHRFDVEFGDYKTN